MVDPSELDPFFKRPYALGMTETSFEILGELAVEYDETAIQYLRAVIEVLGAMGSVLIGWGGHELLIGKADDDHETIELYDMLDVIRAIRDDSQETRALHTLVGISKQSAHTLVLEGDNETDYIEVLAHSLDANVAEVMTMGIDLRKAMLDAQREGLTYALSVDGVTWAEITAESAAGST